MLTKFLAQQVGSRAIQEWVDCVLAAFASLPGLCEIVLFGSAARATMTDQSDLDLVLIFNDREAAREGAKLVPSARRLVPRLLTIPMDILCSDLQTYAANADVGGVFTVARDEGIVIYRAEADHGQTVKEVQA